MSSLAPKSWYLARDVIAVLRRYSPAGTVSTSEIRDALHLPKVESGRVLHILRWLAEEGDVLQGDGPDARSNYWYIPAARLVR